MDHLFAVLFLALAVPALCQIHLGPEGTMKPPNTCYNCDGHHNTFPNCLNHPHDCHHDEICSITYGNGDPKIRCQKAADCTRETEHFMRNCTGGGVEVHLNECKKCCHDGQCTSDLTELLKLEFLQSPHMMCPGTCHETDVQTCIDRSVHCTKAQFCQVTKEHEEIRGECREDHDYHHCTEELNHHPCEGHVGGPGHHGHHGKCYWDCCDTLDCLNHHFGGFADHWTVKPAPTTMPPTTMPPTTMPPTTMPPTTMPPTTMPPTTMPPTTMPPATMPPSTMPPEDTMAPTALGASLWERFHGDCDDQLLGDDCAKHVTDHDVCSDRLAMSVCPRTCGLCDGDNSTVCKDTVVDDGCKDLMLNEDVCSDPMAIFLCPKTCNMCDQLVNSVVNSIIDASSTVMPATAGATNFPTFNCDDLKQEPCGTLDALCGTSLVNVVCPNICDACKQPIQTASTAMVVDMSTPAATTQDMASTTMAPAMNGSTAALCSDHLNGMNCADLKDVCQSVMALSVCPKYCGLCGNGN